MKFKSIYFALIFSAIFFSCNQENDNYYTPISDDSFEFKVDQFADLSILRYQIPRLISGETFSVSGELNDFYLTIPNDAPLGTHTLRAKAIDITVS